MTREVVCVLASAAFLCATIILLPGQFLFSKIVTSSLWTEIFPLPFGAGWFITFVVLMPVMWLAPSLVKAAKLGVMTLVPACVVALPISMFLVEEAFTVNNLLNQSIWAAVIFLPPYLLHMLLRWGTGLLKNQPLGKSSK